MHKSYFTIALRNMLRNKTFSFINITGLVLGIACTLLICCWIFNEISYDRFHKNADRLYETWSRGTYNKELQCWNSVPKPLTEALKSEFPEVESSCKINTRWFVTIVEDKKMSSKAIITDPSFLSMFSFPLIKGDIKTALNDVYSIVITEKMAVKMFGEAEPLGKVIEIDDQSFHVKGVLKDLPLNSSLDFEFILPWEYYKKLGYDDNNWRNFSIQGYVLLKAGVSEEQINSKISDIIKRHTTGKENVEVFLHPLSKWHLYSKFENGVLSGGRIEIVRLFGIIAAFILLIACINFMNLSTARSEKRAKEVGIRKVNGALKKSLIYQFLLEAVVLSFISGFVAILLFMLVFPSFNALVGRELEIPYTNVLLWMSLLVFILITGLLAGSYPAFFLSSFSPIDTFRGTFKKGSNSFNPRKLLVVFQFCVAITLIISTAVVVRQINHAQKREAGFVGNKLMYHWITGDINKNYSLIKNELLTSGVASSVTRTMSQLTQQFSSTSSVSWKGKDPHDDTEFERGAQDEGMVQTVGLKLIQGRDLDLSKYATDSTGILLNASAVKVMGFENPIGQTVLVGETSYHVVGVFEDYIFDSPYEKTRPMIIEGPKYMNFNLLHIRLTQAEDVMKQVAAIEKIFLKYNPHYPFEYHFVDQDYAKKFEDLLRVGKLSALFALLTILISCLGLFGLTSYMAENRVKEIGIRKILGASPFSLIALLSRDFLVLIFTALFIASPLAWYVMNEWLQSFSYRTSMGWDIFAGTTLLVIILSLITTSYHAVKASMSNPVKNLRSQ